MMSRPRLSRRSGSNFFIGIDRTGSTQTSKDDHGKFETDNLPETQDTLQRLHPFHERTQMSLEEELKEGAEHAHQSGEKKLGLTMAIVAVLLAIATLLGHRAHTEEVVLQGERNTQ